MTALAPQDFTTVYRDALPRLRRAAAALTATETDADDLVQVASLRMYAKREHFAPGTDFERWAVAVLRNCYFGEYRRQRRRRRIERERFRPGEQLMGVSATTPTGPARLSLGELEELLARLSPVHRESFEWFYAGYSIREIATRHGVPEGTVKSRLFAARDKLRRGYLARERQGSTRGLTPDVARAD